MAEPPKTDRWPDNAARLDPRLAGYWLDRGTVTPEVARYRKQENVRFDLAFHPAPERCSLLEPKGMAGMVEPPKTDFWANNAAWLDPRLAGYLLEYGVSDRVVFNHEHFEVALGYAITRKMIDDSLYESEFPASNLGLQNSFAHDDNLPEPKGEVFDRPSFWRRFLNIITWRT